MRDLLVNLIETKGWLSIYDLYFDNAANIRVLSTKGCIAFDKTTNTFFFLNSIPSTESTVMNSSYIHENDIRLGQLGIIGVTTTDHLQRFNMNILKQRSEFIAEMELPTIPKAIRDVDIDTYFRHKVKTEGATKVEKYTNQTLTETQFIQKDWNEHGVQEDYIYEALVDEYYLCGDLKLNKSQIDEFISNRATFKTFLVNSFGVTLTNLI